MSLHEMHLSSGSYGSCPDELYQWLLEEVSKDPVRFKTIRITNGDLFVCNTRGLWRQVPSESNLYEVATRYYEAHGVETDKDGCVPIFHRTMAIRSTEFARNSPWFNSESKKEADARGLERKKKAEEEAKALAAEAERKKKPRRKQRTRGGSGMQKER
jgi:hypothetical protein